jgi:hypothetical protein
MPMTPRAKLAEPGRLMSGVVCVIPSAVVTQAIAAAREPTASSSTRSMAQSALRHFTR